MTHVKLRTTWFYRQSFMKKKPKFQLFFEIPNIGFFFSYFIQSRFFYPQLNLRQLIQVPVFSQAPLLVLDYRWSNNPPIYQRTFAPNWYRTHTVPKFGLQSSYRSMPVQPAHFTDNIVGITLNSQHFTFFAKLAQPPCNLATLQPYFKKTL